jgi:ABC-2 type transport system permease protein
VLAGTREALLHGAGIGVLAQPFLLPLVVISVVSVPLGLWVFLTAERYAKRTGRLKRNG